MRDLRANARRHLVSVAGIALAVAVVVGAIGSRDATRRSIDVAVLKQTAGADLLAQPLGGLGSPISSATRDRLTALPGVRTVATDTSTDDEGRPREDRLLITLAPGTDVEAWYRDQAGALPLDVVVQPAAELGRSVSSVGNTVNGGMDLLAGSTLFMGCLLAFHINQVAAAAGRRNIGMLRTIGATRRDVMRVVTALALLIAAAGALAGCVLGYALARWTTPVVARLLGLTPQPAAPPLGAYLAAFVATLIITAVSVLAGRRWSVPPLAGLVRGDDPPRASPRRLVASSLALLAAVLLMVVPTGPFQSLSGFVVLVISVWFARELFVSASISLGRRGRHRAVQLRPTSAGRSVRTIGGRSIERDAALTGISAALVMATFAVVIATAVAHDAVATAADGVLARTLPADIDLFRREALPDDLDAQLRGIAGVTDVATFGVGFSQVVDPGAATPPPVVRFTTVEPQRWFAVSGQDWRPEDEATARAAIAQPGTVGLSQPLATMLGRTTGDEVRFGGPHGPVTLRVVGVFGSFIGPYALINDTVARDSFAFSGIHGAEIDVEPGQVDPVRLAIAARWPSAEATSTRAIRTSVRDQLLSLFSIGYAALVVAALLCTLGLGASMSAGVIRREDELRLLRSIGSTRRQVVRMIRFEVLVTVAVGLIAALPLGLGLSMSVLQVFRAGLSTEVPFHAPIAFLIVFPLLVVPVGLVATIVPARRAARVTLV